MPSCDAPTLLGRFTTACEQTASSPALRPQASPSSSEVEASRFAPRSPFFLLPSLPPRDPPAGATACVYYSLYFVIPTLPLSRIQLV